MAEPAPMPMITPELAGQMVDKAIAALEDPEIKKQVDGIIAAAKEAHPAPEEAPMRQMKMMQELLPLAQKVVGDSWKDWGVTPENAMMVMMQVQMMAMSNPELQPKAQKVMSFFQGSVGA
mmetsp:Transcript_5606/g.10009  ORF Transcript_5606/g.10009 Transcript_5606/m.10009 type:complete len:120 (+) Transcript_5606:77-436(+)|eukprot:CAMPEP_0197664904 /NCGR_PEP_ID=MMETSP1338-20131121/58921_1 /TAXON_ID=43686 ORGANISM="Pelagodinium beii, Strain RCC1491" /NCGR_SAMPLE_ID=MMETSP1338 /ASSEMBLY_ACC=CAM_ASM_000754 /LENGTH=119 /DNA_ID=CAMNT_0043243637 /DNA_START=75 /DNA_END=434 /DNA_ORIENTATION=+